MAQVVINVTGDREVIARLEKLGGGVLNLTKPFSDIGRYLTGFFSGEVFASRGGVIGEPWQPLDPLYAVGKAQEFPGRPPLIQRGTMNRSFKSNAGRASVLLYNSDPKFDWHQAGTRRLPPRVMMKVDQTRTDRVVDIIDGHLAEALR